MGGERESGNETVHFVEYECVSAVTKIEWCAMITRRI